MFDRNARVADAYAYKYALAEKGKDADDNIQQHYQENGKDSTYYVMLGRQDGLHEALVLLESYIKERKIPFERNSHLANVRSFEYVLAEKGRDASDDLEQHYQESGKDPTYYIMLGKYDGLHDALVLLENYINGGKM